MTCVALRITDGTAGRVGPVRGPIANISQFAPSADIAISKY